MTTVNYILQPKSIIIYAVVLITLFEATAQVFLKKFEVGRHSSYLYLLTAVALYFIVCCLLCLCYKNKGGLGKVNLMWSCMSMIFVILFGYIFLQEEIKMHDMMAIFFAFLAIYFANMD
uniref:EamA domain-containing protein n=1 Tax=viral metagenome TaxID=1070528 RepID=A0A6C0CVZ9_9ZZZZ